MRIPYLYSKGRGPSILIFCPRPPLPPPEFISQSSCFHNYQKLQLSYRTLEQGSAVAFSFWLLRACTSFLFRGFHGEVFGGGRGPLPRDKLKCPRMTGALLGAQGRSYWLPWGNKKEFSYFWLI